MMNQTKKSARILLNTVYMYFRMIVLMGISFYTARVVLQKLGIENYGIYNLVGGVVIFWGYISNGLGNATKRYITASISKNDIVYAQHVFNVCQESHFYIAIFTLLIAELFGPWIIYQFLNIPPNRHSAAQIVYQISVMTSVLGIIQAPYGAVIVAYEQMNIFAILSGVEVFLKLVAVILLQWLPGDKLILYAVLMMLIGIINIIFYFTYCRWNYPVCKFRFEADKPLLKEILVFTCWSVLGQAAAVLTNHGIGIIANLYYGVIVNAAIGVSNSITKVVTQFLSNFQVAFNPQIIKSYTSKEYGYLQLLLLRTSKISSYLVMIFFIPLVFVVSEVMTLWLGEYPQYSEEFCIYTLCCLYIEAISAPLFMLVYAQTNIRKYQLIISLVYAQSFTLGWLVLFLGAKPYYIITVRLIVFTLLLIIRLVYTKIFFPDFVISEWVREIILKGLSILVISLSLLYAITLNIHFHPFFKIIVITLLSTGFTTPLMYFIGLTASEKSFLNNLLTVFFRKKIVRS